MHNSTPRTVLSLLFLAAISIGCGGDDTSGTSKGDNAATTSSSGTAVAPESTSVTESNTGLRDHMVAILKKVAAGEDVVDDCKALLIPNHKAWFKHVFGEEMGSKLGDDYDKAAESIGQLTSLFKGVHESGKTVVDVISVDNASSTLATGLQVSALKAMKNPVKLYSVKFVEPGELAGMKLWSFVFVDGGWRLASKMKPLRD